MAKLEMKHIELLAPIEQAKGIIDLLQLRSVIELTDYEENESLYKLSTAQTVSQFEKYHTAACSALAVLNKYAPENKGLLASFNGREELPVSEYLKKADATDETLSLCFDINSCEKTIAESKAGIARYRTALDGLEPWLALDVPMRYEGTAQTAAVIGSLPLGYTEQSLAVALAPYLDGEERFECEIISSSKERSCIFVLCAKECKDKVYEALREIGFVYPSDATKHPPRVRYERFKNEIEKLNAAGDEAVKQITQLAQYRRDIEFVCDYFAIRRDKYDALKLLSMTDRIFVARGYIPAVDAQPLKQELESKFTAAVSITDAAKDEEVPVLLKNNEFCAPIESVTAMYALPNKDDVDPNPVIAFFYYVFFGLMLSDAGYGLLMVIGTLCAKKFLRLEKNMQRTMNMFCFCGISTVFWGALFGSWFGDIIQVVAREFFGKEIGSIALWFEPVNDPMKLLMYSFLFGIVHLFVGLGVRFVMLWKDGKKLDAICETIPIYLIVTGAAPLAAGIIITIPEWITGIAKYVAIAGVAAVILTAGRGSKSIVGKLGGGLYGLYNVGSGYLGDILSYSRLLALGLSTGVIASVVNMLGTIPQNIVLKAIVLFIAFFGGHTVNIAINLIGTYVHTNRLQYVEFFSKFYEGGGKAFAPLTTNTKYFKFKEEINNG